MKVWLVYLWDKVRGSFWFAPAFPEPADCADLGGRYERVVDALAGGAKDESAGAAADARPRTAVLTPDRESRAEDPAAV